MYILIIEVDKKNLTNRVEIFLMCALKILLYMYVPGEKFAQLVKNLHSFVGYCRHLRNRISA